MRNIVLFLALLANFAWAMEYEAESAREAEEYGFFVRIENNGLPSPFIAAYTNSDISLGTIAANRYKNLGVVCIHFVMQDKVECCKCAQSGCAFSTSYISKEDLKKFNLVYYCLSKKWSRESIVRNLKFENSMLFGFKKENIVMRSAINKWIMQKNWQKEKDENEDEHYKWSMQN